MQPLRRVLLILGFRFFDLGAMSLAFFVSLAFVRFGAEWSLQPWVGGVGRRDLALFVLAVITWQFIFDRFHLYDSHRLARLKSELFEIVTACFVTTAATLAFGALLGFQELGLRFGLPLFVTSLGLLGASRVALRMLLARIRVRGRNLRHAIIVGTNEKAVQFSRHLQSHPELGFNLVGFIDDGLDHTNLGAPIIGNFESFIPFLRDHVIDEVFIYAPLREVYEHLARIVNVCEEQGIIIRLGSDVFDLRIGRFRIEKGVNSEFPAISIYTGRHHGWPVAVKRLCDVIIGAIALAASAPIMLVTALAIKFTSPGPVFFVQERVGLNKRRFRLVKFRTMYVDAESKLDGLAHANEADGPVFKMKNDPRVTPVGGFFRRTSIDELPQLFNVLLGDMSLVGPRPLPLRDYDGFDENWTRRRFSVRPGITCIWQVSGRSNLNFERWMELDMEYIDQWSLLLDLKILMKTLPAILRADGAY